MNKVYTLYVDQLKRLIAKVEENQAKNPLASSAVTVVISDDDNCLKLLQKNGHDWAMLDEEKFCVDK
ncbi:MAG: hypothetical protein H6Q71_1694 [Firmicutes bacterium]|nr:hypothetical protein [Bacillota bacterium]